MRHFVSSILLIALCGCQSPPPPNDPFLYRTTVPPPGSVIPPGPQPGPQAYYPSTAPGPLAPGTTIPGNAPPLIGPGTTAPPPGPIPAPVSPAPPPVPPISHSPRDSFTFPQSSTASPATAGTVASAGAAVGTAPKPPDSGATVSPANFQTAAADVEKTHSDSNKIRIIEPPAKLPTDKPIVTSGTPGNPNPPTGPVNAATSPPATAPTSVTAARPTSGSTAAPEITDLPAAKTAPAPATSPATASAPAIQVLAAPGSPNGAAQPVEITSLPAAPASTAPAAAPVSYPGDRPGVTYGYDPGYTSLRGQLVYTTTIRLWRLRYLPASGPIDEYGGSVVIQDPRQLKGFESGDFVTIQGKLSPPGAAGDSSAVYSIDRIKKQ